MDARIKPAPIPRAQRRQQQPGQAAHGPLAEVGQEPMEFLVKERIDQALTVARVHGAIDADSAAIVVDVAVVALASLLFPSLVFLVAHLALFAVAVIIIAAS